MKSTIQYSLLLFLLGITSLYASYYSGPMTCRYSNQGAKKTCNGTGTSDMSELLKYMVQGKKPYVIAGTCEGIYGVWGFTYKCKEGVRAVSVFNPVYAYIVEMPQKDSDERIYIAITLVGCPSLTLLTISTKGYVPGTTMSWTFVYSIIIKNSNPYYPAKCNVIPPYYNSEIASGPYVAFSCSSMISMRAKYMNGSDDYGPRDVATKYKLSIEQEQCGCTYMQEGYSYCGKNECPDPMPQNPTLGRALCDDGYNDYDMLKKPGGMCALIVRITEYFATTISYYYRLLTAYIVYSPYDRYYQLKFLISSYTYIDLYQLLFGCC